MATTLETKPVPQSKIAPLGQPARAPRKKAVWEWKIVRRAIWDSFLKLNPRTMMGNPVMFVVEIGSVITTVLLLKGGGAFKFNSDHSVAVVHRSVRKLRRSNGRRPWQGSGGYLAALVPKPWPTACFPATAGK